MGLASDGARASKGALYAVEKPGMVKTRLITMMRYPGGMAALTQDLCVEDNRGQGRERAPTRILDRCLQASSKALDGADDHVPSFRVSWLAAVSTC